MLILNVKLEIRKSASNVKCAATGPGIVLHMLQIRGSIHTVNIPCCVLTAISVGIMRRFVILTSNTSRNTLTVLSDMSTFFPHHSLRLKTGIVIRLYNICGIPMIRREAVRFSFMRQNRLSFLKISFLSSPIEVF